MSESGIFRGSLLRELGILCLLTALLGAGTLLLHPKSPSWKDRAGTEGGLTLSAVAQYPGEFLWVDARSQTEFANNAIPGAVWVSEDDFDAGLVVLLEVWDPAMGILVYCGGGECQASKAVAQRLKDALGMEEVYWLEGGLEAWEAQ